MNVINSTNSLVNNYDTRKMQLNIASKELDVANEQLQSGKNDLLLNDYKVAHKVSLFNSAVADSKQIIEDIKTNQSNLNESTSALKEINEIIKKAINVGYQGASITNDSISMAALSKEVQDLKDNLLKISNTKDLNGDYVFGGYKNSQIPFVVNSGILDFNGQDYDHNQKTILIGEDEVKTDFPPNAFFRDLYSALDKLSIHIKNESVGDLTTYYVQDSIDPTKQVPVLGDIDKLKEFLKTNTEKIGTIARQSNELDARSKMEKNRILQTKEQISGLTDNSMAEAFIEQAQKQRVYENLLITQMSMEVSNKHRLDTIFKSIAAAA